MCNNDVEDEKHMFMDCTFAVNRWKETNLWNKIDRYVTASGSFSFIIFSILTDLDAQKRARFSAIMWSILRSHNSCLWEQKLKKNSIKTDPLLFILKYILRVVFVSSVYNYRTHSTFSTRIHKLKKIKIDKGKDLFNRVTINA